MNKSEIPFGLFLIWVWMGIGAAFLIASFFANKGIFISLLWALGIVLFITTILALLIEERINQDEFDSWFDDNDEFIFEDDDSE